MNTAPNTTRAWWRTVILAMESYLVLATIAFMIWEENRMEHGAPITWIVEACVIPFAGLLVGGIILLFRRQTSWGWGALAFAFYAFVFLGFALPWLAKSRS